MDPTPLSPPARQGGVPWAQLPQHVRPHHKFLWAGRLENDGVMRWDDTPVVIPDAVWIAALLARPTMVENCPHAVPRVLSPPLCHRIVRACGELALLPAIARVCSDDMETLMWEAVRVVRGAPPPPWCATRALSLPLLHVPEECLTSRVLSASFDATDGHCGGHMEWRDIAMIPAEVFARVVARCPAALGYVPPCRLTRRMCFGAVSKKGMLLQYVPHELHTGRLVWAAVLQDGRAIVHAAPRWITPRFVRLALRSSDVGDDHAEAHRAAVFRMLCVKRSDCLHGLEGLPAQVAAILRGTPAEVITTRTLSAMVWLSWEMVEELWGTATPLGATVSVLACRDRILRCVHNHDSWLMIDDVPLRYAVRCMYKYLATDNAPMFILTDAERAILDAHGGRLPTVASVHACRHALAVFVELLVVRGVAPCLPIIPVGLRPTVLAIYREHACAHCQKRWRSR